RGATELIAPEGRDTRVRRPNLAIEEIACIESAVAQELVRRAVEGIGAGLRHDADLSTGAVAELGGVHIGHDVEFPDRLNPEQLSADAPRSRADGVTSAGVFHSVPQENVLAGTPAGHREIVSR